jgi:hypothetical protein
LRTHKGLKTEGVEIQQGAWNALGPCHTGVGHIESDSCNAKEVRGRREERDLLRKQAKSNSEFVHTDLETVLVLIMVVLVKLSPNLYQYLFY